MPGVRRAQRADNTPSCGCTHRAAEALRDARTAEAAAAEDFDPLRIRPYVELDDETAPLPRVPVPPRPQTSPSDATMPLRAVTSVLPTPLVPPPTTASPTDLRLFEAGGRPSAPAPYTDGQPRRVRRRTVLLKGVRQAPNSMSSCCR